MFDEELQFVDECDYLIIIDKSLCFKPHINSILDKIAKKVKLFFRIDNRLTFWSRILINKSIVAPHFDYWPTILYFINESEKINYKSSRARQ